MKSNAYLVSSDQQLLTLAEVASALRVSKRTVHREIQRGHLQMIRVARFPRVSVQSLQAYISKHISAA